MVRRSHCVLRQHPRRKLPPKRQPPNYWPLADESSVWTPPGIAIARNSRRTSQFRVDESTGTLEARAAIPNPHSLLVPGQYVRVILHDTNLLEGLFLPQAAVQADQQGSFVLIVDANSMVARRNVELADRFDDKVLVMEGVDEGDQVIVRGLQQVRPGMPVTTRTLPTGE